MDYLGWVRRGVAWFKLLRTFLPYLSRVVGDYGRLLRMPPGRVEDVVSRIPKTAGIYVLYEDEQPLRIGRAGKGKRSNLRERLKQHFTGNYKKASFAVALAREETNLPATYKKETSAKHLVANHRAFVAAFDTAKKRIRNMEVRWVEEPNPDSRYLLEFYAAKELQTPYNDFRET